MNGDGYADLIVGVSGADNNGRSESGSAYVLFGKASGFANIDFASLGASDGYRIDGAAADNYCGISVSTAGDVNGDGYADLIVGAYGASNNGRIYSGSAYVLFGKASGFANIDLASLGASDGYRIDGAVADDLCGGSVSTAGDVNGDGYADLIVAASYASNNGRAYSGSAYVLFGKASGFSNIDLASLGASDGYRIDGAAANDRCGISVSTAGDVSGDGYADLIVGAYLRRQQRADAIPALPMCFSARRRGLQTSTWRRWAPPTATGSTARSRSDYCGYERVDSGGCERRRLCRPDRRGL